MTAYAVDGQLRRLPAAREGGVRGRRPAARRVRPDVGQLDQHRPAAAADDLLLSRRRAPRRGRRRRSVATPSGNFGNLTAGLMAKRAGLPIARFVAATNVNDVVPEYLRTGRFAPRASVQTLANAMDVGNPSNFDRMRWLYGGDVDAMRRDVAGSRHDDDEVRATIRRVYEERGYLLDPHSAIGYLGLVGRGSGGRRRGTERVGRGSSWRRRIRRSSPRSSSRSSDGRSTCPRRWPPRWHARAASSACRRRSTRSALA